VGRAIELTYVHDVVLVLQDSSFIVVNIKVVWGAEDGHDARETGCSRLAIHSVASILSLVGANDGQQVVLFQEGACGGV